MLSQDLIKTHQVLPPIAHPLLSQAFADQHPLWEKGNSLADRLPAQKVKLCKRYPFSKLGRILGMETPRYLCIYEQWLFYFEEAEGGTMKGICNLQQRYVEWHKTQTGKHLFLVSNGSGRSVFLFQSGHFWAQHKEEITKHAIRTSFQKEYTNVAPLGEGSFANVSLVRSRHNGRKYAAKKISKLDKNSKPTKKLVIQQRRILAQLQGGGHTCGFVELFEENNQYILVLEHIEGQDLLAFLKENPEMPSETAKAILASLLHCLKAVHTQKIIHRDIKPHNILIDSQRRCRLIDFGLSLDTKHPLQKSHFRKCGTVGYMAPEVFANQFACLKPYNTQSDMFSFGIVACILLLGNNPLKGKTYDETYELNRLCDIPLDRLKITEKYGSDGVAFLRNLLQKNAKARYTAEDALNSKFLHDWQEKQETSSTLDERRKLSEQSLSK